MKSPILTPAAVSEAQRILDRAARRILAETIDKSKRRRRKLAA